jgi:hypothetical protein
MVFFPLFMVNVVGVTATASGLTISPLVLGIVVGNVVSGQLAARIGRYKTLMLTGLTLMALGFLVMMTTLTTQSTQRDVTIKMVLLGLGLGPALPLYTLAIQNVVRPEQLGIATSMVTFIRQLGAAVGLSLMGSLFATTLTAAVDREVGEIKTRLPPAVVERILSSGQSVAGDLSFQSFSEGALKSKVRAQLAGARSVVTKALRGETMASMIVAQSPLADAQLKELVAAGGVSARTREARESWVARIEAAAADTALWLHFLNDAELPRGLSELLARFPAGDLGTAAAREAMVAELRAAADVEARALEERLLSETMKRLDEQTAQARDSFDAAIESVARAFKEGLTDGILRVFRLAFGMTLLAFFLTLGLSRRPDHRTG